MCSIVCGQFQCWVNPAAKWCGPFSKFLCSEDEQSLKSIVYHAAFKNNRKPYSGFFLWKLENPMWRMLSSLCCQHLVEFSWNFKISFHQHAWPLWCWTPCQRTRLSLTTSIKRKSHRDNQNNEQWTSRSAREDSRGAPSACARQNRAQVSWNIKKLQYRHPTMLDYNILIFWFKIPMYASLN